MTRERSTTFTSIGSEDSTDEFHHFCEHGKKRHPQVFCTHCSEFLCEDCYKSHKTSVHHFVFSNDTESSSGHISKIKVRQARKSSRKDRKSKESDDLGTEMQVFSFRSSSHVPETQTNHVSLSEFKTSDSKPDQNFCSSAQIKQKARNSEQYDSGESSQSQTVSGTDSLPKNPKTLTAVHETDICCDKVSNPSRITAIILIDDKILATDYNNNSIKVIDIESHAIMSEMTFSTGPWDLTEISKGRVAVTFTKENKVTFLYLKRGDLAMDREISVSGYCDGISSYRDMLVVTYLNPGKVEILDIHGKCQGQIQHDRKGNSLFQEPRHVAMAPDGNWLYVSDFQANAVTCVSLDGEVLGKYTDSELRGPENLCVDSAVNVYVCGGSSNNIHLINARCEKMCVLLTQNTGLMYPQSVYSCAVTMKLYVGMDENTHIMVCRLQAGKRKKKKKKITDRAISGQGVSDA